jgi:glycosyltransferase involved in cell wall biosynthesis
VFSRTGATRLARVDSRVSYLPTWYDPARVRARTEASPVLGRALWVGRFEEEKDPLLALTALEVFVAAGEHRSARMLGAGAMLASARDACVSDRVQLPGAVSIDAVAESMVDADVLLMTSRFEGSPVVMSEALAAGTPVVATAASDPDQRIDDGRNGLGDVERSAEALAAALGAALGLDRTVCIESVRDLAAPQVVPRLFVRPDAAAG